MGSAVYTRPTASNSHTLILRIWYASYNNDGLQRCSGELCSRIALTFAAVYLWRVYNWRGRFARLKLVGGGPSNPRSWEVRAVKWRWHVVPNCCKGSYTSGCYVPFREPPTKVFWQTAGWEAGTALCCACHCAALYEGGRVTSSCLCCRLLLCFCRRYIASGTPVHHQELLWVLFQCLWICYQGKKQI